MSRALHASLQAKLNSGTTNLCHIVTITRKDGQVFRYTDLDIDVTVSGNLYESSNSFQVSAITSSSNNGIQSTNCNIFFSASGFTEIDTVRGAYDYAAVEFAVVDYIHPEWGKVILLTGKMSSINGTNRKQGQFEMNGILSIADQKIGEYYSSECRANLADVRCKVPLVDVQGTGAITGALSNSFFYAILAGPNPIDGLYNNGVITFTSGLNLGVSMEIISQLHNLAGPANELKLFLSLALPNNVQVGDTFDIVSGCDKRPITCKNKFDNIVNFRGEPFVPGSNYIMDLKKV